MSILSMIKKKLLHYLVQTVKIKVCLAASIFFFVIGAALALKVSQLSTDLQLMQIQRELHEAHASYIKLKTASEIKIATYETTLKKNNVLIKKYKKESVEIRKILKLKKKALSKELKKVDSMGLNELVNEFNKQRKKIKNEKQ